MPPSPFLGDFEHIVLLALLRLGPDAYGTNIRRELEERTGRTVSVGALYTTLGRLERKGFISSSLGDPTPERGGRAKRFFTLERSGRQALEQSRALIQQMWSGVKPTRN
jgi:PadR family transcriptional regulator PadR